MRAVTEQLPALEWAINVLVKTVHAPEVTVYVTAPPPDPPLAVRLVVPLTLIVEVPTVSVSGFCAALPVGIVKLCDELTAL